MPKCRVISAAIKVAHLVEVRKSPMEIRNFFNLCLEVAHEARSKIRELACDCDDIHLLIDVDPRFGVHRAVKHM